MPKNNLPALRIETCKTESREPGLMVFNVRPGGRDRKIAKAGWIIAIDQSGEIAFSQALDAPTQDTRLHPNGNILFSQPGIGLITEIDRSGQTLRQWHVTGKWADKTPPAGSIAIDVPLTHHTFNVFPSGNFLMLSAETRLVENWPGSDTDPDAPRETAKLVGDIVLEVTPEGRIEHQWHMLDMLDPYRICYGSRGQYWIRQGIADSNDWCHANCASYDVRDDSIVVSLRTQDCIIKFDRGTGDLRWILGTHDNWRAPWSEKLLTPKGPLDWQFHQHDCSVTPAGTILCFDNGNYRAAPFSPRLEGPESYSRIVEFDVDENAGTVRQLWSFGDAPKDRLYACYQGGAYRLPKTGNSFMTYGGVCTEDGVPSNDNTNGFGRARLVELSPDGEILFDMWVDDSDAEQPQSYSVFRAEHIPAE